MAQVEEQVYTKDRPPPIEGQLISVQAHIEDLEVKYILSLQRLPANIVPKKYHILHLGILAGRRRPSPGPL